MCCPDRECRNVGETDFHVNAASTTPQFDAVVMRPVLKHVTGRFDSILFFPAFDHFIGPD